MSSERFPNGFGPYVLGGVLIIVIAGAAVSSYSVARELASLTSEIRSMSERINRMDKRLIDLRQRIQSLEAKNPSRGD